MAIGFDNDRYHIPTTGDETGLRRLGVNVTCDPNFASNKLFVS